MNRDTLVAINITHNNILDNPNEKPILFYWDGEEVLDILSENIYSHEKFKSIIYEKCCSDIEKYNTARVDYFYFKYIDGKENYAEGDFIIQQIYTLEKLDNDGIYLWRDYASVIFNDLYKSVFKKDFEGDILADQIIEMYNAIKEKKPLRIVKTTVIEYVRAQLKERFNLTSENADFIYNKLDNLIND